MKLQTKLSVLLIGGVLLIYLGSCLVSRHFSLSAIDRFSQDSQAGETERQWQWVECLQHATDVSLVNAMTDGDMDKFEKILADEHSVPGLQELSLYDAKGRIAYSSLASQGRKELPDDLKRQLLGATQPFKRLTSESFEIYQPLQTEKSCIECHKERKLGDFCGILSIRFSTASIQAAQQSWTSFNAGFQKTTASIQAAQQSWTSFNAGFQKTSVITSGITIVLFTAGMGLLVVLLVHFQVAAPLKRVARDLTDQAGQVDVAATQMSSASQTVAEGASEQAASLEETSSSLEELSSTTRLNAGHAQQARDLAGETRSAADRGVADMGAMNAAMSAIKVSSDDIAKIIKTIDEIAFQTNILALNAAVEAARAGEAGMGFSVVADEVRNLAQRSAQAARETAAKIEGAITNADRGVELNRKVSSALNEIVEKARHVDELVAQVAGASREQTQGIAQINLAVNQMDKVTQGNAASAEECAAAGGELKSQARAMNDAVCALLQLLGGQSAGDSTGATGLDQRNGSVPVHVDVAPISVRRNAPGVNGHHRPVTPPAGTRTGRIIVWDAATMSTGVESVDAQHRTLIDRINELHSACEAGTAREKLLEMLSFLGEYAQNHFKEEEGIMQQHRCPVRGQNKAAHIQFLADYEHLVEIVKRDGPTTSTVIQIKKMLANWLTNHICRVDANLRNCAKNTGR